MAKKKPTTQRTRSSSASSPENPELSAAEERLREAREQLTRAREYYQEVRDKASQDQTGTVASVVDEMLKLVRKYPGAGVATAALVGFVLGRTFKR